MHVRIMLELVTRLLRVRGLRVFFISGTGRPSHSPQPRSVCHEDQIGMCQEGGVRQTRDEGSLLRGPPTHVPACTLSPMLYMQA